MNMARHFNANPDFQNVYVKGEVSNTYTSQYGHFYFTLKDNRSQVPCILRRENKKGIGFEIEHGMKLLVVAGVSVYWPHGKYQLDIKSATEDGLGKLFIRYQQLKKKLEEEGLFDRKHKKELPRFPARIGVVTSESGAVIHDIIKTVSQKWPYCNVVLFPAAVQGINSKRELIAQIETADRTDMDVLIVGRGGGSIEDLWSFNEEEVVRCIFNAETPIISAIGHEDDVTLSDLVADVRASTPTMAAGLAIEDRDKVQQRLNHLNSRLNSYIFKKIGEYKKELEFILDKSLFRDSTYVYGIQKTDFNGLQKRFTSACDNLLSSRRVELNKISSEYVIRHPCKMQLDISKHNLAELTNRLMDAVNFTINNQKRDMDKTTDRFNFLSDKLVTSKRHELDMSISYFAANPCQKHIDDSGNELRINQERLVKEISRKIEDAKKNLDFSRQKQILKNPDSICLAKSQDFEMTVDRFMNVSNRIVLASEYRLDSYRKAPVIKNHINDYIVKNESELDALNSRLKKSCRLKLDENRKDFIRILNSNLLRDPTALYESKKDEFDNVVKSKIIENPYSLLENSRNELRIYEEKLENISQVITLKKEQQRQKSMYIKIIAAIVIAMIIILIVMLGGIL